MAAMLSERGVVYGLDLLSNVRDGLRAGTIDQGKLHGIRLRQLLPDPQHRPHKALLRRRHTAEASLRAVNRQHRAYQLRDVVRDRLAAPKTARNGWQN